jgi:hypothetical protein
MHRGERFTRLSSLSSNDAVAPSAPPPPSTNDATAPPSEGETQPPPAMATLGTVSNTVATADISFDLLAACKRQADFFYQVSSLFPS